MNNSDLKYLKKQFQLNKSLLTFKDIYSVFIKKDIQEVLGTQYMYFGMLYEDYQKLLLRNMRKILSGDLDVKIFVQKFNNSFSNEENYTQKICNNILNAPKDTFMEQCNVLVKKLLKSFIYDSNLTVYFIRFSMPIQNKSIPFVICTVNKVEPLNEQIIYNYNSTKFEFKNLTDPIVKMSPIEGFMYPLYENGYVSYDKVLYYSSKANKINPFFVSSVLNCHLQLTASQERDSFHKILNEVVGGKIKPIELHKVYSNIMQKFENQQDEEYRTITPSILTDVLESSNVTIKNPINEAYKKILKQENYKFKVKNVIPNISEKSIHIKNSDTEINIRPDCLENIRQVKTNDGDIYLLIRLNENVSAENFDFEVESIEELLK